MGNSQSPSSSNPQFTSASRAFTAKELEDLRNLFVSLSAQSNSNGEFIAPTVFKAFFGVRDPLGGRLFSLISKDHHKLSFEDLVIAKSVYEKGTKDEIEEFIYKLLDVNDDGFLWRSDLEGALSAILGDLFSPINSETGLSASNNFVDIFVNSATFSEHKEGSSECSMSLDDFRSWCSLVPSARKVLGGLLTPPDAGRSGFQVPRLVPVENVYTDMIILRSEHAWHISGYLPPQELDEWKLLYHSAFNGLSFTTFLGNISSNAGPTVLVVKDKEGCVYGGYASQPWEKHGDFYGDLKCYLFQLYPKATIFRPTGANSNLQWCAMNFSSDSIPNGIGFGGQINHFGLFLSANFDQGQTFACTTFGSPCLSKSTQIHPEVIECWGVVTKDPEQEKYDPVKGTVLERFKEDRNMLNLVGIAASSD